MASKANEVCSGSKDTKRTCITEFDREVEIIEYMKLQKKFNFLFVFIDVPNKQLKIQ